MIIEDLLSVGFFAKELPPPFNTKELATKYPTLKTSLTRYVEKYPTRCINYSIAKVGILRKDVKIPNPIHQIRLSEIVTENWADIEAIYNTSKISCSKPIFKGYRAANPMSFKDFIRNTFIDSYQYSYELKTDISKYYPSIYTHSIPWAIHSKTIAKTKRSDKTLLGNKLDSAVQATMYGQTMGIPIGPDTSLIIAEIIGCFIDEQLRIYFPDIKGYRYVDDMYFFFNTYTEAENCLLKLQKILGELELHINSEKTVIRKIPKGIEPEWIIKLRTFQIREKEISQYNDLITYFGLAFDLSSQYPNEYILTYALQRIKYIKILSDKNYSLFEMLLLKTIIKEPSTIKEVFRLLFTYRARVNKSKITPVIFQIIENSCPRGHDYELSWALWCAKTFNIKIPKNIAEDLSTTNDTISILIILDLLHSGLIEHGDLDTIKWESDLNENSLKDDKWLFAYEVAIKGWLPIPIDYILKVPFFEMLRKNGISFYNSSLQIEPLEIESKEANIEKKKVVEQIDSVYMDYWDF